MPWLKLIHIIALMIWSAALLYLPALVAANTGRGDRAWVQPFGASRIRTLFTHLATPLALLAIASGSGIFLLEGTLGLWLIFKLTLVVGMVLLHVGCGLLILKAEQDPAVSLKGRCLALGIAATLLIASVLYLVLAKPV